MRTDHSSPADRQHVFRNVSHTSVILQYLVDLSDGFNSLLRGILKFGLHHRGKALKPY